jgi:hypothetical protein
MIMAFTMHDPEALRRYIGRTRELLDITPGEHAQALLRQMIRDAERQLASRSQSRAAADADDAGRGRLAEVAPLPLGGTAIELHLMSEARLQSGIRDATELAARILEQQPDAAQLVLAGIELAISELVLRSVPGARDAAA